MAGTITSRILLRFRLHEPALNDPHEAILLVAVPSRNSEIRSLDRHGTLRRLACNGGFQIRLLEGVFPLTPVPAVKLPSVEKSGVTD